MCGIVGMISKGELKNSADREKFFKQALLCDVLRGYDSTGMFAVPSNETEEIQLIKRALPAWDFLDMQQVTKIIRRSQNFPFMIGHNRAATKGVVNKSNAHPFYYGDIIGVHNGTLTSHYNLPDSNQFVVDSAAIMNAFNHMEAGEVIEALNGAFALIWYDMRDQTLNICRNDKRPLHMIHDEKKDSILIASEYGMLDWLAARNGFEGESLVFESGYQYSFPIDNPLEFQKIKRTLHVPFVGNGYRNGVGFGQGQRNRFDQTPRIPTGQSTYSGSSPGRPGSGATQNYGVNQINTKARSLIRKSGYQLDEMVEFLPLEFQLYNPNNQNSDKGMIHGLTTVIKEGNAFGESEFNITLHGMTEVDFAQLQNENLTRILAPLKSVIYAPDFLMINPDEQEQVPTLILDSQKIEAHSKEGKRQEQKALPPADPKGPDVDDELDADVPFA